MRIVIIAPGSRGDVQPYIALGKGLQNAGHSIRLVSHSNFETLLAYDISVEKINFTAPFYLN